MQSYEHLRIELRGDGLVQVTLDRPPANALSVAVIDELGRAATELSGTDTRLVVLRSSQPVFMAGADLNMVEAGWEELRRLIEAFQTAVNLWEAIPAPTIAVINGHAAGAGCELSLACDWRLMARGEARIGLPEVLRGLMPAAGGTQRMARLIGRARALDVCLRGRMLDADTAEALGLISAAIAPDELEAQAQVLADELLALPQMTLRAIKRCIVQGSDTDLQAGLRIEAAEMYGLGATEDAREGVRAFLEKRKPVFAHR